MPIAMQFTDELQAEARPSKRARLDQIEDMQGAMMDNTENNHLTAVNLSALEAPNPLVTEVSMALAVENPTLSMKSIPGLGLLGQAPAANQSSAPRGKSCLTHIEMDRLI
jgi:hypothetical protein